MLFAQDSFVMREDRRIGLTFFHSAATCLHEPEARRKASRRTSRGSGGPTNGTWSAAVKSWPGVNSRSKCNAPGKRKGRSGTLTNLLPRRDCHALSPDHPRGAVYARYAAETRAKAFEQRDRS